MATNGSSAAKESEAVVQAPPQSRESSSRGAGLQHPYHSASWCEMATGGSSAAKESGACTSGSPQLPPSHEEVRPAKRVCSVLITAPPATKWQPASLVPLRSLGLVVQAPPQSRGSLSHGAGLKLPYRSASRCEMATGGSSAAKESGACSSGSPPPVTRKLSPRVGLQHTYHSTSGCEMATGGSSAAKESGACSSGSPPVKRKFVPWSGFAASLSQRLRVRNGNRLL
ncbi:hypothetical protein NDU88_004420 [Pleurodeles waltl]|uniref:Uncharacterized protein n=1 Tax=Pleurodeles waltl TaxID=8319 RepID=A0AAV7L6N5_PLEWA|nr:hypothetical protein NDU88_004420 [Pleurodeles waltl]